MNCVFLNTKSCLIYCYQCDLEIVDRPLRKQPKDPRQSRTSCAELRNEATYLDLRKLFSKKIDFSGEKKGKKSGVNGRVLKNDLFPLKTLLASLVNLYSVDYIRKVCKKRSLAHLYSTSNYKVKLFKSGVANFFDGIFELGREGSESDVLERLYFSLLREDSQLFKYQYSDFHVV